MHLNYALWLSQLGVALWLWRPKGPEIYKIGDKREGERWRREKKGYTLVMAMDEARNKETEETNVGLGKGYSWEDKESSQFDGNW